jgi:glucose/arabinose dehydrogenase
VGSRSWLLIFLAACELQVPDAYRQRSPEGAADLARSTAPPEGLTATGAPLFDVTPADLAVPLDRAGDLTLLPDLATLPDLTAQPDPPPVFGLAARPVNTTCIAPLLPADEVELTAAFDGRRFVLPVALAWQPDDPSRAMVAELGGRIQLLGPTPATVDLTDRVSRPYSESGLLSIAYDPWFASSHHVYLSYLHQEAGGPIQLRLSRITSDGDSLDLDSEEILFTVDKPTGAHNGGQLAFGPDGYLYLSVGDGYFRGAISGGSGVGNGQDPSNFLGKMLRLDVHGASPYRVPADNPFVAGGARPEVWALGFRNPWRWSFDRVTGDLWLGDVGENAWEEIDVVEKGGDYGWNRREGAHCFATVPCEGPIDPVAEYPHLDGNAVVGGYVYHGAALPALVGQYLHGDYPSGQIWALSDDPITNGKVRRRIFSGGYAFGSFAEGPDGELYILSLTDGTVRKLTAADGVSPVPAKLSQTGCVDARDPRKPAPGLIPYDINVPFHSDGAAKERWIALPNQLAISATAEYRLELPLGSVVMKTFTRGGKRLETRLLMRTQYLGRYVGYSYRWNDDESDAVLLDDGQVIDDWWYPSRGQCFSCHNSATGFTIGLELAQLHRDFTYPGGVTADQLATWEHIGLLSSPLPAPIPRLGGDARSYLPRPLHRRLRPRGRAAARAPRRQQRRGHAAGAAHRRHRRGRAGGELARRPLPLKLTSV